MPKNRCNGSVSVNGWIRKVNFSYICCLLIGTVFHPPKGAHILTKHLIFTPECPFSFYLMVCMYFLLVFIELCHRSVQSIFLIRSRPLVWFVSNDWLTFTEIILFTENLERSTHNPFENILLERLCLSFIFLFFSRNFEEIMNRFEPTTPEQLSPSPMGRKMSLDPVFEAENKPEVRITWSYVNIFEIISWKRREFPLDQFSINCPM